MIRINYNKKCEGEINRETRKIKINVRTATGLHNAVGKRQSFSQTTFKINTSEHINCGGTVRTESETKKEEKNHSTPITHTTDPRCHTRNGKCECEKQVLIIRKMYPKSRNVDRGGVFASHHNDMPGTKRSKDKQHPFVSLEAAMRWLARHQDLQTESLRNKQRKPDKHTSAERQLLSAHTWANFFGCRTFREAEP